MNPAALEFAMQVLQELPTLIEAGVDIVAHVKESLAQLKAMVDENRDPNQTEWDALNARIADLRKQLS